MAKTRWKQWKTVTFFKKCDFCLIVKNGEKKEKLGKRWKTVNSGEIGEMFWKIMKIGENWLKLVKHIKENLKKNGEKTI